MSNTYLAIILMNPVTTLSDLIVTGLAVEYITELLEL